MEMEAFLRTWPYRMAVSCSPLERAVATYCLAISSIIVERVIWALRPITRGDKARAGKTIKRQPSGPKPLNPEVGSKSSCTDTIRISIRASQNWGTEMTAKDRMLTMRSTKPRGRRAASIPKGMPIIPIIQATMASTAVLGRRSRISSSASMRWRRDLPKPDSSNSTEPKEAIETTPRAKSP